MGYLLYCILSSLENRSPAALAGVDGQPVFLVSSNGLSAAISRINQSNVTPEISCILAYQRVVESFHCHPAVGGVIPVRYGALFGEEFQIIRLLKERSKQYKALLKELDGCVEMGIRILISDFGFRIADSEIPIQQLKTRNSKLETSGRAYLAARKVHYEQQEKFNKQAKEVIEQYRAAFNGLFLKCKTEFPSIGNPQSAIRNPVLSLYFLVRREHAERFRQVFRKIRVKEPPRLLLSGPWPPYNFVQPDHIYGQESIFPSLYE